MADTFSPDLKIRLPQTGAYENTWGAVLNSDAFTLLDKAITGRTAVNIGASTAFSLPALSNGTDSSTRYFCLLMQGTPAAPVTVTVPPSVSRKLYLIDNQTGQPLTFTYASSTNTATVAIAERRLIWCDGTNCFQVAATSSDATTLAGVAAANYARLDIANVFQRRNSAAFVTVTEGGTCTIMAALGNHHQLTLTGNRTMAAPDSPVDGQELYLVVIQDATGGRTLTWASAFQFENGVAPTLSAGANTADLFVMIYNGLLSKWLVQHVPNIGATGSATYTLNITGDVCEFNLLARLGTVAAAATVNITLGQGVVAFSRSTGTPAMDLSGLPSGSTINFTNNGYVLGCGGDGGNGGAYSQTFTGPDVQYTIKPRNGRNGGMAIKGPGSGNTLNVTNANGHIWGGGGGGGGGGVSGNNAGAASAVGGGGGGGAGGGRAGNAIPLGDESGVSAPSDAAHGSTGITGTFGAGATGTNTGSAIGGDGGAGGDWGADGTDGSSPTADTFDIAGGTKGTAGKAIDINSGTVNVLTGSGSPNVKGAVS